MSSREEIIERYRRAIEEHEAKREHKEANEARIALHKELRELEKGAEHEA